MSDAPSPSSTSDGRQVMVRKRRDPKSRLAAIFNIPLEEPRAELEEERPSAWEPEPWVPLSFRAPPPPFLSQSASEAPSFPPLYSPISGPSLLNVGDEVVENVPTPRRRASSAFSTVSLPSPSQHPRAWSPPPAQHAEEQSEPQPVHPKDSARLRNYSKRRCELLDILSDLHSTGYVHRYFAFINADFLITPYLRTECRASLIYLGLSWWAHRVWGKAL
jgi:hypothetical protein